MEFQTTHERQKKHWNTFALGAILGKHNILYEIEQPWRGESWRMPVLHNAKFVCNFVKIYRVELTLTLISPSIGVLWVYGNHLKFYVLVTVFVDGSFN
jgi:hypothetical protein